MPVVVGIRFKDSGKTYFFDPNGHGPLDQGDQVVVETVRGPELAKVAYAPREVPDSEIVGDLKPVLRRAERSDFDRLRTLNARQTETLARCAEKIAEHSLPMRLVKSEYSFDGSRLTFYFTAEKRVDFRMLVRDLARLFRTRIELRQIGPRDEAKLLGGIGPCGRLLCCATFLPDYARVSIKMAKDQDLPLNPTKISGVCGRLLCCLSYEHEQYLEIKGELPKKGAWVQTPEGPGEVVALNVVRETVMVELAGSLAHEEFAPSQLSAAGERVAALARSRTEEGITPAARMAAEGEAGEQPQGPAQPPQRRDRDRRQPPEPREPRRNRGERRLLRDEIDNPEVLDALAMLEDGGESEEAAPEAPRQASPEQPERQEGQRRAGPPQASHRPTNPQRRAGPPQQRQGPPPPQEGQPRPPQEGGDQRPQQPRRRRRKG